MFNLIKTVVSKFMNLFLRVFELIINMMLKGLHISLYVLTFGKEWFLWTFRNLFFILKVVGIFFFRLGYVFVFLVFESLIKNLIRLLNFNVYYALFFFNYVTLRIYQIKILVVKLSSQNFVYTKPFVNFFSRINKIIYKNYILVGIINLFLKLFGYVSIFLYEAFSFLFLLVYWFGLKVYSYSKLSITYFFGLIKFGINNIVLFFLSFYRLFLRAQFKIFFKLFYKIKLFFFESKIRTLMYLKKNNSFFYGFFLYSRPGYILLIFYLYFVLVFPWLQDLGNFMLISYFDLSPENWSWYGGYFPLNDYFANFLPSREAIELYNNKSVWFFKFGEYGDVFLISTIITICYFLVFVPYFRNIWFYEPNWEATEMDVDTDDTEWDEEVDDDEFSEPADPSDAFQDGDELDEYYDELREKSIVRGRVGNNTIAHGYVLTREMGWGVFISYWIFVCFYTVKTFFWPETGWSPSFQIYDFEETFSNVMPFIEHYPLRNLQIYSSWMPGSPINSPWAAQDFKNWRKRRPDRLKNVALVNNYVFDKWNAKRNKGYGELGTGRSLTFSGLGKGTTNYSRILYDAGYLFRSEQAFFLRGDDGYMTDILYGVNDVDHAIYQNYPIGFRNKTWKRSVWFPRAVLNPMYNYGFNYLDYWPRQNAMKAGKFNLLVDSFYKNNKLDKLSNSSLYGNSEMVSGGRSYMLNKTYKHFVFDTVEPGNFPLTYTEGGEGTRKKKKGFLFRKRFFRGHKNYLDSSILTTLGDKQYRLEKQIEYFRDRKAPFYLLTYDYGLTPYHLGVSNKWWNWLNKPLTTDISSLKYFLAFLTELNKNFDKSYERYILLKLWQNYWGGKFNVGEYFLNSNVLITRSYGDVGHIFQSMAEAQGVKQTKYFKYTFMGQSYYDNIWEEANLEMMPLDVIKHIGKFDKEMEGFDLDFATEYLYPYGMLDQKNNTVFGLEHVASVSSIFNPLPDKERFKEFFSIWKDLPTRNLEHYLQATLIHEELGQIRYRVPKLSQHVAHNFYKKNTLGVITSLRNRYLHKREYFPTYPIIRSMFWKHLERQENVLYYIFYPKFDDYIEDLFNGLGKEQLKTLPLIEWASYYPEGFKTLYSYLKFNVFNSTIKKQAEAMKENFKEYFSELITHIAESVFDAYDGTEVDESLGLRTFPYNSKQFVELELDRLGMEEYYRERFEEFEKASRVMRYSGDDDKKEDFKVIIQQYYKRHHKRMEVFGKRGFDKYQNFFLRPYLYDIRFRDLLFKELGYPSVNELSRINNVRPRWNFIELFDYSGFSFFVLDDTLHFNLNHLELEEEYPLYKLPSNMYLSEDYLLVKEKIIPLLAQSLNNWIAEIENPKILNKLEFKEQYNTVATVWEFVVSFYRNVFRFFGLSTDRIVDFFYDLFLKYGFYSGSNYEAFFYVFDNFKQPFIGFEDNINNYTVEYRNYGRIENPGRGNKLSFVEKELPDVFDFVPGANTYPEAKQLKIFDEFFAYYRKFFLWEQNTVSQRNVSLTKLKNVGKNNILSLDLTWMKPVYKLGYDIEFNLYKNIEINKNFVMLSFFLDKSVHIKSRIEGQLSDYDTMVRDLLNSKKMEFPVKDRDMFPMVKDRTEFFSYFRRMESNRINESSVSDFSNLSSLGYKELIVGDDFENDFWKGDLTTKYLYTYDLNFLKLLWKS